MDVVTRWLTTPMQPWDAVVCTSRAVVDAIRAHARGREGDAARTAGSAALHAAAAADHPPRRRLRRPGRIGRRLAARRGSSFRSRPTTSSCSSSAACPSTPRPIRRRCTSRSSGSPPAAASSSSSAAGRRTTTSAPRSPTPAPRSARRCGRSFSTGARRPTGARPGAPPTSSARSPTTSRRPSASPRSRRWRPACPSVVSDWNGYRDTVRDGVDGFAVPTLMPPPGSGQDLAMAHAIESDNYDAYIGRAALSIVVDVEATAARIRAARRRPRSPPANGRECRPPRPRGLRLEGRRRTPTRIYGPSSTPSADRPGRWIRRRARSGAGRRASTPSRFSKAIRPAFSTRRRPSASTPPRCTAAFETRLAPERRLLRDQRRASRSRRLTAAPRRACAARR